MEERYHATTQNRLYPDMSNVNKNITVEAKLISPPTYIRLFTRFKKSHIRSPGYALLFTLIVDNSEHLLL